MRKPQIIELMCWALVPLVAWIGRNTGVAMVGTLGFAAVTVGLINPRSDDSVLN
jgi:hypothetical protein